MRGIIDVMQPDNWVFFKSGWIPDRDGNFFIWSRLRLLVKENMILEFFKTDYIVSLIRSNTCPSTCRPYFMFTLEKTSNDVKFHAIFVNY